MKTEITFEYNNKEKTSIKIMRGKDFIGHIWSEQKDGTLPYPHDKSKDYCKNSIQICGFDRISEIWSCGPFTGKKDCVVNFTPMGNEWHKEQLKQYEEYVKRILRLNKISKMKSYNDWIKTGSSLDMDEDL